MFLYVVRDSRLGSHHRHEIDPLSRTYYLWIAHIQNWKLIYAFYVMSSARAGCLSKSILSEIIPEKMPSVFILPSRNHISFPDDDDHDYSRYLCVNIMMRTYVSKFSSHSKCSGLWFVLITFSSIIDNQVNNHDCRESVN